MAEGTEEELVGLTEVKPTEEAVEAVAVEKPKRKRRKRRTKKEMERAREKPVGRPKKWLIWRCDKYPNLRVVVAEWQENKKLKMWPYAEFIGGGLNVKKYAKHRGLNAKEVDQLNKAVSKARYVWVDNPSRGQKFKCGHCGREYTDRTEFLRHVYWQHQEELNIKPNPETPI